MEQDTVGITIRVRLGKANYRRLRIEAARQEISIGWLVGYILSHWLTEKKSEGVDGCGSSLGNLHPTGSGHSKDGKKGEITDA